MDVFDADDAGLAALAASPAVSQQFPGMFAAYARLAAEVAQCASCAGAGVIAARNQEGKRLREAIAGMAPDARARLKAAIGAKKLRVIAGVNHQGALVRHTF